MAVSDPWMLLAGGCLIGGLVASALIGPLSQTYQSLQKGAFATAGLVFVISVVLAMVGVFA